MMSTPEAYSFLVENGHIPSVGDYDTTFTSSSMGALWEVLCGKKDKEVFNFCYQRAISYDGFGSKERRKEWLDASISRLSILKKKEKQRIASKCSPF